jgi:bifunctional UDP-N-acetylglucosamine pyrophosphorylase/glucosamine-1-phosphate N-acetyltransferase
MRIDFVILAAGQGSRMKSDKPKVIHEVGGMPMVSRVIQTARTVADLFRESRIHVVIGHGAELVREQLSNEADVDFALQAEQLGTGHAVMQAMESFTGSDVVVVLYGDVPLLSPQTLERLVARVSDDTLALLTVHLKDPSGYGRIVRDEHGSVRAIVEHKDASAEQLNIREVNTGILAVSTARISRYLPALSNENVQGEYYLTDVIAMAVEDGMSIETEHPADEKEVEGANNRLQIEQLERWYQRQQAEALMVEGVAIADASRIDIRGHVRAEREVFMDVNVVLEGDVFLGTGVHIGPNVVIRNAHIDAGARIEAFSHIENARIGAGCTVGPYARLRPGTVLESDSKVGNFCELKNATLGSGAKVNHLSYVGDASVGARSNIGAGTITCNYDGANKHRTEIGEDAFIGSNTCLVAPVSIGRGATTGAGGTISSDVPDGALGVARARQRVIEKWKRPVKKA